LQGGTYKGSKKKSRAFNVVIDAFNNEINVTPSNRFTKRMISPILPQTY
jgi:hypothetical protein